ncbi:MAG: hypothetical protein IPH52_17945 [Leptospiraceae bacterium]|nr:hypothetical protein [Leptospiraceae bacterium]
MMADYVHFSEEGYSIVGKIIGDHLLSLGLVKRHASGEWIHPKEKYIEESVRRDQYLRYEISLNYRTYKCIFFALQLF